VRTTAEAEDAISQLLADRFHQPPASYTNHETSLTTVAVYFTQKPDWTRAQRTELASQLQRIKALGLKIAPGQISLRKLRPQNWAHSWKRHFKPIEIGPALLIRPSWSKRRARKGQITVVLDPGLSFGTGLHPTTAFCLEQLVALGARYRSKPFLDLGTGSGILAIAAAKRCYARIDAIDCDADAIRIARANARLNRVSGKIHFFHQELGKLRRRPARKYSLVCANLISNLLLSEKERIICRLDKHGVLVLSGILRSEFNQVQKAYESAGLRLIASRTSKEWRSGAFVWYGKAEILPLRIGWEEGGIRRFVLPKGASFNIKPRRL
jgi:ribosomal protein L11 methyltransferase